MEPVVRAHLFIKGIVQGVGFRQFILRQAQVNQLSGWVRNYHKDVEVVVEGGRDNVKTFIELCRKGPVMAKVNDIIINYEEPAGEKGFKVLKTIY